MRENVRRRIRDVIGRPVLTTFIIAAGLRIALAIYVNIRYGGVLFGDDGTYPQLAAGAAAGTLTDLYSIQLYHATATYTLPLTWLEVAGFPSPLAGQIYTASIGALVATAVAAIIRQVCESAPLSLAGGMIMAVLPSQVLFSAITLKDGSVWLVAAAGALALATWTRNSWRSAGLLGGSLSMVLLAMLRLRIHTTVVVIYALAGALLLSGRRQSAAKVGVLTIVILLVLPIAVGLGPGGVDFVTNNQSDLATRRINNAVDAGTAIPEVVAAAEAAAASGAQADAGTSGGDGAEVPESESESPAGAQGNVDDPQPESPSEAQDDVVGQTAGSSDASATAQNIEQFREVAAQAQDVEADLGTNIRYLPRGVRLMLIDPLPWQINANRRLLFALLENVLFWYPLLGLAVVGLFRAVRTRHAVGLYAGLFSGGTTVVYGLAEGNFGTAFRHRGEMLWAVVVLAAIGAEHLRRRRPATGEARAAQETSDRPPVSATSGR